MKTTFADAAALMLLFRPFRSRATVTTLMKRFTPESMQAR